MGRAKNVVCGCRCFCYHFALSILCTYYKVFIFAISGVVGAMPILSTLIGQFECISVCDWFVSAMQNQQDQLSLDHPADAFPQIHSPENVLRAPYQSRAEFSPTFSSHSITTGDILLRLPPIHIKASRKFSAHSKLSKLLGINA